MGHLAAYSVADHQGLAGKSPYFSQAPATVHPLLYILNVRDCN